MRIYKGKVKSSQPSLCETLNKWPLDRDLDRSWCHCHTSSMIKLSWLQPTASTDNRQNTRARWKVLELAYNWCETQDMQPLGRDPDRSWCHRHNSIKLFWSQAMAPWTSAAAYEYVHGAMGCQKKNLYSSVAVPSAHVPLGRLSKFHISCRLGHEIFTLPMYIMAYLGE